MSSSASRRLSMTVYTGATHLESHRVRLMLAEKAIDVLAVPVDPNKPSAEMLEVNPRGTLPTIVDRDLTLYEGRVIMDYLDERYPHPALMPIDPVSRARTRLALFRIQSDWYSLAGQLDGQLSASARHVKGTREALSESLAASTEVFAAMPFFLSDEYSVLDATVAPLLWRLPHYGIVLPKSAAPIAAYAQRMFKRSGFQASLSQQEREMSA